MQNKTRKTETTRQVQNDYVQNEILNANTLEFDQKNKNHEPSPFRKLNYHN